jgi:hypothetical protein
MTSAVKNIELIFFMIAFLFVPGPNVPKPNYDRLFCRLGCDEIAHACRESGLNDTPAAQNVGAGLCLAAEMVLASCVLNIQRQLAGGNRSRAKYCGDHSRKQCGFDCFCIHDQSFQIKLKGRVLALSVYGSLSAHMLFQVGNGGVSHHPRPDLLHFSVRIHQDCLRRELHVVVHCGPGIRLQDDRQTGKLVLRNKARGCG